MSVMSMSISKVDTGEGGGGGGGGGTTTRMHFAHVPNNEQ